MDYISHDSLTCVGGLVHGHRQLDYVVHSLGVLGLLRLLAHNPLLHQEPECFRGVRTGPAVPLSEGESRGTECRQTLPKERKEK